MANQPKWRTESPNGVLVRTTGGDTSNIRVGGQAGIFEFIMVLAWWGALIPRNTLGTTPMSQWGEAVNDVVWVLSN